MAGLNINSRHRHQHRKIAQLIGEVMETDVHPDTMTPAELEAVEKDLDRRFFLHLFYQHFPIRPQGGAPWDELEVLHDALHESAEWRQEMEQSP